MIRQRECIHIYILYRCSPEEKSSRKIIFGRFCTCYSVSVYMYTYEKLEHIPPSRNVGGNCFVNCFMGPVSVARERKTVISSRPRLVNNSSAPKVNYALELLLLVLLPSKNNGSKSLVRGNDDDFRESLYIYTHQFIYM